MSEATVRWQRLRPLIEYIKSNSDSIGRLSDFFFSFAIHLAMVVFGALWALMSYAGIDAESAMNIVNADIYSLALFTAVFLILVYGLSKLVEYIGKL